MPSAPAPSPASPSPQLHGWKEISAYFGRSVRTVQRWERDFGLPIRRFGMGRAEVVHAYIGELERWRATAEAEAARRAGDAGAEQSGAEANGQVTEQATGRTRSQGDRWRRYQGVAAVSLVAAALLAIAGAIVWRPAGDSSHPGRSGGVGTGASASEPAMWDCLANTLTVKDDAGSVLWKYEFPFTLDNRPDPLQSGGPDEPVRIEDVDGDGHREVLVRTIPADREKHHFLFHGFSHDGSLRWTHAQTTPQTFGDTTYAPPFPAHRIMITPRAPAGQHVWLVSVHSPWFPSVMSRVEPDGTVSAEYWSNGYITDVWEGVLASRRVVLVGARNNESEGASVALLDAASPSGSAPAEAARFQCRACPPGCPMYFIQIPRPARLRALHSTSLIITIQADNQDRIIVRVNHSADVEEFQGEVIYALDAQLRPVTVGLSDAYDRSTAVLVRRMLIPPPPPSPAIDEVRTIRWWDGNRFTELTTPGNAPAPAR